MVRREGKKPTPNTKGLRLKKTFRGEEISQDTIQINIKVIKPGKKKFEDLLPKKEEEKPAEEVKPVEQPKPEEKKEEAKEQPKEEKPTEPTPTPEPTEQKN